MTFHRIFRLKKYDKYYPCTSEPGTSRSLVGDAATGQEWPTGLTGFHGCSENRATPFLKGCGN